MTHRYVHILFSSAKPCAVSQVPQAVHHTDFLLPNFWGKSLFPAELSAVTRANTLASASLRDPCRTHTNCPPKIAGQLWDSLQQLHFQKGPFFSGTTISTQTNSKRAMFYEILSLFLFCSCLSLSYVSMHASNEHCRPLKMSPTD